MKRQVFLKQFEYYIPPSVLVLAGFKMNHFVAEHLPLMKVIVDFENGKLKIDGDWQFMMVTNKHNQESCFTYYRERVKIEMAVYPAQAINLDDPYSDGLVFPLNGSINDGNCLSGCSGLLLIDNVRKSNGLISNQWNISFYLYNTEFNDCEIKFKLPVYI